MKPSEPLSRFADEEATERALRFLDVVRLVDHGKVALGRGGGETLRLSTAPPAPLGPAARARPPAAPRRLEEPRPAPAPTQKAGLPDALNERLFRIERAIADFSKPRSDAAPGAVERPIGNVRAFLEDIKFRGFHPRGLLDVGANIGDWTRMALSIYPDLAFVLIEPQREMVTSLQALAARPGCHFVNAAAGAQPGEAVQTIWPDLGGSSFLPPVEQEALASGRQRLTPIVTIDAILKDEAPTFEPDLVKLDIQGFELEALRGGTTLFGRTEVFIIEMSLFSFMPRQPLVRDVMSFMAARMYEFYDITEYGRRPFDGALGQVDFAFVKSDGLFRRSAAW